MRIDDIDAVDRDAKLPKAARLPSHLESELSLELRRHPGGDQGLDGSEGAVVDVGAAHGALRTWWRSREASSRFNDSSARCMQVGGPGAA